MLVISDSETQQCEDVEGAKIRLLCCRGVVVNDGRQQAEHHVLNLRGDGSFYGRRRSHPDRRRMAAVIPCLTMGRFPGLTTFAALGGTTLCCIGGDSPDLFLFDVTKHDELWRKGPSIGFVLGWWLEAVNSLFLVAAQRHRIVLRGRRSTILARMTIPYQRASHRNCCYGSFQTVSDDDKKGSEKVPSHNFLSNVRRLLSTGTLGRAAMKYIAWSLEVICLNFLLFFAYIDSHADGNTISKVNKEVVDPEADAKRDQRTVYVSGIPLRASREEVNIFFSSVCKVRNIDLILDPSLRVPKAVGVLIAVVPCELLTPIGNWHLLLGQPMDVKPLNVGNSTAEKRSYIHTGKKNFLDKPWDMMTSDEALKEIDLKDIGTLRIWMKLFLPTFLFLFFLLLLLLLLLLLIMRYLYRLLVQHVSVFFLSAVRAVAEMMEAWTEGWWCGSGGVGVAQYGGFRAVAMKVERRRVLFLGNVRHRAKEKRRV
ncbi:hypothetical protein RHMOL_Rhmol04G0047900 [Rhododendron molle]|uniref:Uncharacterized protein n=1 Tax=Rhododendron molle TaxID=49168 RepID=A0ACC0NX47_RHOML|nr:hypothetical protein RHMOL_Rhmol04G0047900 [Rhododendron molle]